MTSLEKIIHENEKGNITIREAFKHVVALHNIGRDFIFKLIDEEEELKKQLSKNLDLYRDKKDDKNYKITFLQWNKSNLVIWDLKDFLCRIGEDIE